jgi:hypothetical protein
MGEGFIARLVSMTSKGLFISITWIAPLSMSKVREIISLPSRDKDVSLTSFPGSCY